MITPLAPCFAHLFADRNFRQEGGHRYIWLVADPDDDLCLREADDIEDDQTPEEYECDWLAFERECVGWEDLLGVDDRASFLAGIGVAPGQPFLVWCEPYYSRDYYGEHDFSMAWDVVAKVEMGPADAADMWNRWIEAGYTVE